MISDQLKKRVIDAMKRKDEAEKSILRVALGDIQTEGARQGRDLDDAEAIKVLKKVLKGIEETLAVVTDAAVREKLEAEKRIVESFLPQTLSVDQIISSLAPVLDPIKSAGNDGQAIGLAVKHLKTTGAAADGKDVAAAVKQMRG